MRAMPYVFMLPLPQQFSSKTKDTSLSLLSTKHINITNCVWWPCVIFIIKNAINHVLHCILFAISQSTLPASVNCQCQFDQRWEYKYLINTAFNYHMHLNWAALNCSVSFVSSGSRYKTDQIGKFWDYSLYSLYRTRTICTLQLQTTEVPVWLRTLNEISNEIQFKNDEYKSFRLKSKKHWCIESIPSHLIARVKKGGYGAYFVCINFSFSLGGCT